MLNLRHRKLKNRKTHAFSAEFRAIAQWLFILFICLFFSTCQTPDIAGTTPPPNLTAPPPSPAVILMIGDGMGLTQMSAALYTSATPIALEQFNIIGLHKAHSSNDLVTDSAASATAMATGIKTYNGAIGLNADTLPVPTLLEQAEAAGMATGLVVTSTLVHATPAAFAAHQPMRIYYERIANDLCEADIDLLIGGGKRFFDRRTSDDRDLVAELQTKGYMVRDFLDGKLDRFKPNLERPFLYFSADNQPLPVNQGRSYLSYAAQMAADFLDQRGQEHGFFLLVEGSQIDWANHANEGKLAIQETLDFDRAVGEMLKFARQRGNTLLIVTADHESGGMAIQDSSKPRKIRTEFTTNGHTATLVPVYAYGPGAEAFAGVYDNTDIYHKMHDFLLGSSTKSSVDSLNSNTLESFPK